MPYGAFIVPGLIMLSLFTQSIFNASFGIYLPEIHRHDLRTALGADLAVRDRDRLCRRGGDQVDRARPDHPRHRRLLRADPDPPSGLDDRLPGADRGRPSACSASSSASGRKSFEQLQFIPMLIVTPLTFLGGAFYSIDMLPPSLADDHPVQPGRLSDQRLPLELLRRSPTSASGSAWRRPSASSCSASPSSAGSSGPATG